MIYLLLIVLLVPTAGWAGEQSWLATTSSTEPRVCWLGNGPAFPARQDGRCYAADAPNCLATMTAAMRAMEPFISYHKLRMADFDEAMKLWAEARTCWKVKP